MLRQLVVAHTLRLVRLHVKILDMTTLVHLYLTTSELNNVFVLLILMSSSFRMIPQLCSFTQIAITIKAEVMVMTLDHSQRHCQQRLQPQSQPHCQQRL